MPKCIFCGKQIKNEEMFKLHLIKCTINQITPQIDKLIPSIQPKKPISKIIERIFKETEKNFEAQPEKVKLLYQDGNFPLFFNTVKKVIIYICEKDPHYRGWMAYWLLAVMDIMNWTYRNFNHCNWYKQNKKRLKNLKTNHPLAKPILFLDWLIQHNITFKLKE